MDKSFELSPAWEIDYFDIEDTIIRYAIYKPCETVNKFFLLINGRNEFIEKYSYIIEDLALPKDCGFITWDHRGQGNSGGQTSHCESFDSYIGDAAKILAKANPQHLPYVILGHSMGGLISVYGIMKGVFRPDFLLLSAPFLGMPEKPLPHIISRPLADVLTRMGLGRRYVRYKGALKKEEFLSNQKTHSRQRYVRMKSSPYQAKSVTYAWVKAAFSALDEVNSSKNIKNFKTPTYIIVGDQETVVDIDAMHIWLKKIKEVNPEQCSEISIIRGAKHELLSEAKYYYDQAILTINGVLKKWSKLEEYDKSSRVSNGSQQIHKMF